MYDAGVVDGDQEALSGTVFHQDKNLLPLSRFSHNSCHRVRVIDGVCGGDGLCLGGHIRGRRECLDNVGSDSKSGDANHPQFLHRQVCYHLNSIELLVQLSALRLFRVHGDRADHPLHGALHVLAFRHCILQNRRLFAGTL